jgi:hypothetical protein
MLSTDFRRDFRIEAPSTARRHPGGGTHLPTLTLTIDHPDAPGTVMAQYLMHDAVIMALTPTGTRFNVPLEELSVAFARLEFSVTFGGQTTKGCWDS